MERPTTDRFGPSPTDARPARALDVRLTPGSFVRALIIVLAAWVLHGFFEAVLAACVTAVASWPLYTRFSNRLPVRRRRSAAPLAFTGLMIVFVLAPLVFAFSALLGEAHALLLEIAAADQRGIALPRWLGDMPLVGPWLLARWQSELAHPGTLLLWAQRTDPALLLDWAQSLGQFTARHAIIIVFTILLLYFLYRDGEVLSLGCRRVLRQWLGAGVEHYIGLGTRAVRASVNSMLLVGLFDGLATAAAFALAGVPQAAVWAAITGALALVPFLGYVAVIALALHLTVQGAAATAALALALGCAVLLAGDKLVRPAVAGAGVGLPFVWVLMGCLGGFEVLGLVGVVVGPVVLTLARELWEQRVRDVAATGEPEEPSPAEERHCDATRAADAEVLSNRQARASSI
jgi:predicted PurR-regulated permease PerM